MQVDGQGGREQVILRQEGVNDGQHGRVLDDLSDRRCLRQQGVDPLGLEALEVVAAHVLLLQIGRELRADPVDLIPAEQALEDEEAALTNGG